jgi:hypothetical protein
MSRLGFGTGQRRSRATRFYAWDDPPSSLSGSVRANGRLDVQPQLGSHVQPGPVLAPVAPLLRAVGGKLAPVGDKRAVVPGDTPPPVEARGQLVGVGGKRALARGGTLPPAEACGWLAGVGGEPSLAVATRGPRVVVADDGRSLPGEVAACVHRLRVRGCESVRRSVVHWPWRPLAGPACEPWAVDSVRAAHGWLLARTAACGRPPAAPRWPPLAASCGLFPLRAPVVAQGLRAVAPARKAAVRSARSKSVLSQIFRSIAARDVRLCQATVPAG